MHGRHIVGSAHIQRERWAGFSVTGSFLGEYTNGSLSFTVSGTATNAAASTKGFEIAGTMQPISFAVPQTFAGGVPFPTTLIVSKLTETSSTLSNIAQSSMQVPAGTQRFSSATLGAEFLLDFTPAIIKAAPFTPPNPQVRPAVFPAGDQIQTASFKPYYSVQIPANTTASFDESFTFELRYLPEPSAPLMLGSGAGLLGLLASVVGPRLGS